MPITAPSGGQKRKITCESGPARTAENQRPEVTKRHIAQPGTPRMKIIINLTNDKLNLRDLRLLKLKEA